MRFRPRKIFYNLLRRFYYKLLGRFYKVSVIVPVFNGEETLRRAIDSVIMQTHKNWEIIAINDGSTDGTAEILKGYENKYKNIRVYYQENAGLSASRNRAMELATGYWTSFLDADDYYHEDALQNLVTMGIWARPDIVIGSRQMSYNGEIRFVPRFIFKKDISDVNLIKNKKLFSIITVMGKLYRTGYIRDNQFTFPVGITYEDYPFTYETYLKARKISVIAAKVVTYTRGGKAVKSITESRLKPANLAGRFRQIELTLGMANTPLGKERLPFENPIEVEFGIRLMRHIKKLRGVDAGEAAKVLDAIYDFAIDYKGQILNSLSGLEYFIYVLLFKKDYGGLQELISVFRTEKILDRKVMLRLLNEYSDLVPLIVENYPEFSEFLSNGSMISSEA